MIPYLDYDTPFPRLDSALREPNGLLAAGADLSPDRLLDAYRQGIFPWYADGQPILWWSPDPRMVVIPQHFAPRRSLAKVLRNKVYEVRCDSAFKAVIRACAATPREGQDGTWINEDMIAAYVELHRRGHAHSIETWIEGELVGGLYGLSLGRMFYGESMFAHATDASKIAFAHLCAFLTEQECGMIDCQMNTEHLSFLGGIEIERADFAQRLGHLTAQPAITGWGELARRYFPDGPVPHHQDSEHTHPAARPTAEQSAGKL